MTRNHRWNGSNIKWWNRSYISWCCRTALGVDAAGTDNSTDVTLTSVTDNYLSIDGQEITAGTVPVSLGGTGATSLTSNGLLTGNNTSAISAESNLTYNSGNLTIHQGSIIHDNVSSVRASAVPSAQIINFIAHSDLSSSAGCAVKIHNANHTGGQPKVDLAAGGDDHVIGILLTGATAGNVVQVQIGGLMKAKVSADPLNSSIHGNMLYVDDESGMLLDAGSTDSQTTDRFILIYAGTDSNHDSLVMWIRGANP